MYKLFLSLIITLALLLAGCNKATVAEPSADAFAPSDTGETDIINEIVFLGESTTYHLKSRAVLSDGTQTKQVWAPKSGTLMLDSTTARCRIVYPETGEELELSVAVARKKPKYLMLTFGLNGAAQSVSKGEKYFKSCYEKLISTIKKASPSTEVILQSCFPIGKAMDMSSYTIDTTTLNGYIDTLNSWSKELASDMGIAYINSSKVLKDSEGFLKTEYQTEDGYHLTRSAYVEILNCIRAYASGVENE